MNRCVALLAVLSSAAGLACAGSLPKRPTASLPIETWRDASSMHHARSAHAVATTGAAIYVIGGTGEGGAPVRPVERFDGSGWTDITTLPGDGLNAPAAVAIGTRIYVIGGFRTTTNVPTADVLVYDTATRVWSNAAPLPSPRGGHAAVVIDGRIHVIGGGNSQSTLADHYEYDPTSNTWLTRAPLSRSKGSPAAAVLHGKLYSIGGRSGSSDFGDVEIYDPATGGWSTGPDIPARGTAGASAYCGTIYVFGGESQARKTTLSEVLKLDTAQNVWRDAVPMRVARNYARAVPFRGSVYLIGGNMAVGMSHSSQGSTLVERFDAC
jgi:N-acetylneuraminic acid mutarotase